MSSQSYEVHGTVVDAEKATVPFANILIKAASDSTLVKGAWADDMGAFSLSGIKNGQYFIQASYIGHVSTPYPISIQQDTQGIVLIIPQTIETLEGVDVFSQTPRVERLADKLIFHVSNSVLSQGTSWEILKKTPGVVTSGGGLQIRNQPAIIYINGRRSQLSMRENQNLLDGIDGSLVAAVEIIHNPGAQYDAEGGAILNIVTENNINPGYKGNIFGAYTQSIFSKYRMGTNQYFKTKQWDIMGTYSYSPQKRITQTEGYVNFMDDTNSVFDRWDFDRENTTKSQRHNLGTTVDYHPDGTSSLNFTANYSFLPQSNSQGHAITTMENGMGQLDSTLNTATLYDRDNRNLALDMTYERKLKKEGASIRVNGHMTQFKDQFDQQVDSDYRDPQNNAIREDQFSTDADRAVRIYTFQGDYETPWGDFNAATGAKTSFIHSANTIDYYNIQGAQVTIDPTQSDDYDYDEAVYAAYFSLAREWKKWSAKAGLRGEYTNATGTSNALGEINNQQYFKLFPSASLLYSLSELHSFSLDYSRKIKRPNYKDLNPFTYYLDENNYNQGNPYLQPSFSHNFNLNYTFKGAYFFDVYYRDNGDYVGDYSFQNNERLTLSSNSQNALGSISYGLDFTHGRSFGNNWYLYTYLSVFHEEETFMAEQSGNVPYTNSVNGFYGSWSNFVTLTKDGTLTAELSLNYISGFIQGSYDLSSYTEFDLGLKKTLWNNRAIVSFAAEDLLGKANPWFTTRYLNQDHSLYSYSETRKFRIGFTYNLGNHKLEDNRREINSGEIERLGEK